MKKMKEALALRFLGKSSGAKKDNSIREDDKMLEPSASNTRREAEDIFVDDIAAPTYDKLNSQQTKLYKPAKVVKRGSDLTQDALSRQHLNQSSMTLHSYAKTAEFYETHQAQTSWVLEAMQKQNKGKNVQSRALLADEQLRSASPSLAQIQLVKDATQRSIKKPK